MRSGKFWIISILVLILSVSLFAQEEFIGKRAFNYIEILCKDAFYGRKTGLPGAREAADWIGSQFESWELEPGGGNETYIQEYPFIVTHQKKVAGLILKNGLFGDVTYQEGNDFTVYFNSGSGNVTAEVVFAGFGICEPEKGWDDFAEIDCRGKILFIYRGRPGDGQDWSEENERDYKMQVASEKGAVGLLILEAREWPIRGGTIHEEGYNPELPAMNISRKCARDIFQGTMKNMDNVLQDLVKKPMSFVTGKKMTIETVVERIKHGTGENVIGILPGIDPVLKDEFIVVGGHMDHNGVSADGHKYAGADDNASGTAVVMELARSLSCRSPGLKRSVIFIGFGGEEQGLRGSNYFANHSTVPIEKVCAMFNFDMEGCGNGGGGFGGRNYFPGILDQVISELQDSVMKKLSFSRGWGMGGSDHAHFIEQGIPAFGFYSTGGHPFYHRVEDLPETININSLQFVGDRAIEIITALANWPESLLFYGNRQGRCFIQFGDQVDFDMRRNTRAGLGKEGLTKSSWGKYYPLRAALVPVITDFKMNRPADLFKAADRFEQWAYANGEKWIRYQNAGSFNQAVSSGRHVVLLGLEGTVCLENKISCFRNLVRLGLDVLAINKLDDPVFENEGLSNFGKEILKVCKKENILIDWNLNNPKLTREVLGDFKGLSVIRLTVRESMKWLNEITELTNKKNIVLISGLTTDDIAEDLSTLMDKVGITNIHFSVVPSGEIEQNETSKNGSSIQWMNAIIQKLYELRLQKGDKKHVYNEMIRVLGSNLKTVFK